LPLGSLQDAFAGLDRTGDALPERSQLVIELAASA
jgi:hypothetical protein